MKKNMMMRALAAVVVMLAMAFAVSADTPQCGKLAGGKLCPNCFCCSEQGFCGNESAWCGSGCQSQCNGCGVASLISKSEFEEMLLHHNNDICPGKGFYTYDALVAAAKAFPDLGGTRGGDIKIDTLKREIAAFLAQTSHETMLAWEGTNGDLTWAPYCLKEQAAEPRSDCCQPSSQWPCAAGKQYYGRGPFNMSWNYNYGPAGEAIGEDLLRDPDLVANDAIVSFKTAIWFWMTSQSPDKPSCHDIMTGEWVPSDNDQAAGRLPGYGATTNIINGELECGHGGPDERVESRIAFYKRYCDILGVDYGQNLDCYNQKPFGTSSSISATTATTTLIRKVDEWAQLA